ncbi:hypothetical protein R9X47_07715 [Wukongibacter baidiensis]|uniref:hypothetical protein n=1 Tax=Wukongibacter baidiensis TaxID=1723361 RepID=UPI003D7F2FAA
MKINDIKKVVYNNDMVEVFVEVELEADTLNRWELADPYALVIYNSLDSFQLDHIELIDKGMKVHGYEFSVEEEDEISSFLETELSKINH